MTASSLHTPAALLLSLGLALAPLPVIAAPAATAAAPAATPAPAPAPAAADDKAANLKRAEELFFNGKRLYTEGSYEAAILAFQESYELSKEPQLLYNIGNTYERLGDFANARRYLDQYRAFAPENERDVLSRRISALDQRQREKEQKERDAAAAAAANNPKTGPTQPQQNPNTTPVTQPDKPKKKDRIYGPAAIGLTAGVAVGLGLGIGFGVKASGEKNQALEGCMNAADGTLLCSDASQSALDKRKTSALIADVGFAVAGAAAIALIAVIAVKALKKPKAAPPPRAQVMPYANPRGAGLGFSFRF
jgi:tetratricopeptide (TPR) repeat protein